MEAKIDMASFETGATRNRDEHKHDYDGFLSPYALERYAEYMTLHRRQKNGELRDSDNWKRGIPLPRYIKSLWRHFFDTWKLNQGIKAIDADSGKDLDLETALCGVIFNAMGMLHETVKARVEKK